MLRSWSEPGAEWFAQLLATTRRDRGSAVVVTGPTGTGKTTLLTFFAEHATERGFLSLSANCSFQERDLPLSVLGQLIYSKALPKDASEKIFDILRTGTSERFLGTSGRSNLMQAMLDFFGHLSKLQPVLICVDDFNHADTFSSDFIAYLVRRLNALPIFVALSVETETSFDSSAISSIGRENHRRIRLTTLPRDRVGRLLAERLGRPVSAHLVAQYHALTGGNPALLHALADDAMATPESRQACATMTVVGASFRERLLASLHRGDPALRETAQIIAALGKASTPERIRRLVDVTHTNPGRLLECLRDAGLLVAGHFRHEIMETTVLNDHTFAGREAVGLRVARLLYHDGETAREIATRLFAIKPGSDPWRTCVLREAAEQAKATGDRAFAVTCYEYAKLCSSDEREKAAVTALQAQAEWQVDPALVTRHLPSLTASLRAGYLTQRDGLMFARFLLWHGRITEATAALTRITSLPQDSDPQAAIELETARQALSVLYPAVASYLSVIWPQFPPQTPPLAVTNPNLKAISLLSTVLSGHVTEGIEDSAEPILTDRFPADRRNDERRQDAVSSALLALLYSDRLARASVCCDRFITMADHHADVNWQMRLEIIRSEINLRLGDLQGSIRLARTAMNRRPAETWGAGIGAPLSILIIGHTMAGDLDTAATHLANPIPESMYETRAGLHYMNAQGHFHLSTARFHSALHDFTNCGALMREWKIDIPSLIPWRTNAAQAYLGMGDRDQARSLVEAQISMLGDKPSRCLGISLRILAAICELDEREALLHRAIKLLSDAGALLELAHTMSDLGEVHHALGEEAKARVARRQAIRLAIVCGAEPLRRSIPADVVDTRRIGDDTGPAFQQPLVESLSTAERRVARLAAVGYTNREIADKLHLATGTVEQHLTRTYRKLRVDGRRALPGHFPGSVCRRPADALVLE